MRIRAFLIAATFICFSMGAFSLQASEPVPSGLSVTISFSPAPSNPEAYTCNAEITDLATGATLAKPQILGLKGEASKVQVGDDTSALVLDVLVNKTGTEGSYRVTYTKAGKLVGIQRGSMSLR